jgi:hypothetical protein
MLSVKLILIGHEILEDTSSSQAVPDLLPVAILMGTVILILLISFPLLILWHCYKNRRF